MYEWTEEQLTVFDAITAVDTNNLPTNKLIVINAVAGSSKSTTVIEAAGRLLRRNPEHDIRATVFGAANAADLKASMPSRVKSSTIHSLAYRNTVERYGLMLPIRDRTELYDIPDDLEIPKGKSRIILEHWNSYLGSKYISLSSYYKDLTNEVKEVFTIDLLDIVRQIGRETSAGYMPCTHTFYLKLFHMNLMSGKIKPKELDVFMLDEAGDVSQIALDIFTNYPAKQKVVIGDTHQSIFSFLNLVSAFDHYKNEGVHLNLSKSFRVNAEQARAVQAFNNEQIDDSMMFEGMDYEDKIIKTYGYITRTNANLIGKMIELNTQGLPYKLATDTKINQLFLLPRALIFLKAGYNQKNPNLQYIQNYADKYASKSHLKVAYKSLYTYIREVASENKAVIQALDLIRKFGKNDILTAYTESKEHKKSNCSLILLNGFTSKGLTLDSVTLDNDVDKAVNKAMLIPKEYRTEEEQAEVLLYYVICTRNRHELINAKVLEKYGRFNGSRHKN